MTRSDGDVFARVVDLLIKRPRTWSELQELSGGDSYQVLAAVMGLPTCHEVGDPVRLDYARFWRRLCAAMED